MSKARNRVAMQVAGYGLAANTACGSAITLAAGRGFTSLFWGCVSLATAAATNEFCHDRAGAPIDINAARAQAQSTQASA